MGCPMLPPKPPKPPPPKPPKQPPPPPAASSHADPAPKEDTRSPVSVGTVCEILSLRFRAHWQTHRKHRALARLARHGHVAPHHARELAREGKAEPRPAIAPRGQGIGLGEVLERFPLRDSAIDRSAFFALFVQPGFRLDKILFAFCPQLQFESLLIEQDLICRSDVALDFFRGLVPAVRLEHFGGRARVGPPDQGELA